MNDRIAAVMRPALMQALGATSAQQLRRIPKTNCFFQRAVGTDDFTSAEIREHAALCAPFLAEMIEYVRPDVLILEGAGARDLVVRHQCKNVREVVDQRVTGLRRGAINTFFRRETALLPTLGREVQLLTLGHPSQFDICPHGLTRSRNWRLILVLRFSREAERRLQHRRSAPCPRGRKRRPPSQHRGSQAGLRCPPPVSGRRTTHASLVRPRGRLEVFATVLSTTFWQELQ